MTRILVPTDFSIFSQFAFEAAILLAKKFGSEIHCVHKANIPKDWAVMNDLTPSQIREIELVEEKLESLKTKASKAGIKFHGSIYGGNFVKGLVNYIEDNQIDFLTIGSHGASGKREYFIGSNAQKIARSIHRPILIIKNAIHSLNFKKVIYASGFNESDKVAYSKFLGIIRAFYPEIHLLAINTSSFFTQPSLILYDAMKDFQKMSSPLVVKNHFYNDISIDAGIRHFSESIDADLIAISYHDRHPVKRMFQGSNVELLVNHADLPVLTIDYV